MSFVDTKILFLILSTLSYFEVFRIIELKYQGYSAERIFKEPMSLDFLEAFLIYLFCSRHTFYFEMNIICNNMLFGSRIDHPLISSAFKDRNSALLKQRSWFSVYFMEKILGIMELSTKDVFVGGEQIKAGFIKDILNESDDLKSQFLKYVKSRFKNLDSRKQWKDLSIKNKTKLVSYF